MPPTIQQPIESRPSRRPKWPYGYFLLAAFDLLAVSASLGLSHRLMDIYTNSVTVNREWAGRLGQ